MKIDNREPQAPESYATFWEPILVDLPRAFPSPLPTVESRDVYMEFVNVTEDTPGVLHIEQV